MIYAQKHREVSNFNGILKIATLCNAFLCLAYKYYFLIIYASKIQKKKTPLVHTNFAFLIRILIFDVLDENSHLTLNLFPKVKKLVRKEMTYR
jgi:hypothetical protein